MTDADQWYQSVASKYDGALIGGSEKFYYYLSGMQEKIRYIGDSPGMIEHYTPEELHEAFKMGTVVPATIDEENEVFHTVNGTIEF